MDKAGEKSGIWKKSPQELAAQITDTYSDFKYTHLADGEKYDEFYAQLKERLQALVQLGVGDEDLRAGIVDLETKAKEMGIFIPLKDKGGERLVLELKKYYLASDIEAVDVGTNVDDDLKDRGFVAELRRKRMFHEWDIKKKFDSVVAANPLSSETDEELREQLRKRCIHLEDVEATKSVAKDFVGGNFLYHGTYVEQGIDILQSGELKNFKMLGEDEDNRVSREGGEKRPLRRQTGYEGVSWNYNQVSALPGDRYHLVGFLADPATVLGDNYQLCVPSRPALHELILINKEIDPDFYYSVKIQDELLKKLGMFGGINSVLSNLIDLKMYLDDQARDEHNPFQEKSMMVDFVETTMNDEEMAKILRQKYSIRKNGTIRFSPDLVRQGKERIPVGAVWIQALIDSGRIKNVDGFTDCRTYREVIGRFKDCGVFFAELKRDGRYVEGMSDLNDEQVKPIGIPVREIYFVVSDLDIEGWLNVLVRCKPAEWPRGILLYDHKKIRLEHFESIHRGDFGALTESLRKAIPKSNSYLDYEKDILGTAITEEVITGLHDELISEYYIKARKSIQKVDDKHIGVIG